jgi:hypothetical protein
VSEAVLALPDATRAQNKRICVGVANSTVTPDQRQGWDKSRWEMVPMTAPGASMRSPNPCAFANAGFGNP